MAIRERASSAASQKTTPNTILPDHNPFRGRTVIYQRGGKIRIINMNEDVADIFRMSGFKNLFQIEE